MSEHTTASSRITAAAAQKIIDGGIAHAEANGGAFTIAVVDDSGVLKALTRMDGAPLLSIQVAQDKAYTAVGFGMPSGGWYDFIKDDGPLATGAPSGIDRLVVFAGGFPITIDGAIVGAVGVTASGPVSGSDRSIRVRPEPTRDSSRRRCSGRASVADPARQSRGRGTP